MSDVEKDFAFSVKIEPATLVHTEVLAALHRECFKDPWDVEAFTSLFATPGTCGFLAIDAQSNEPPGAPPGAPPDAPLGFILVRTVAGEGEILSIGVLDRARSRGIGGRLVRAARGLEGLDTLFLDVAEDNESALKLYAREGFEMVGRRSGYYARGKGPRVDSLTMRHVG